MKDYLFPIISDVNRAPKQRLVLKHHVLRKEPYYIFPRLNQTKRLQGRQKFNSFDDRLIPTAWNEAI